MQARRRAVLPGSALAAITVAAATLLTACSFAPDYQAPVVAAIPPGYKESGPWQPAAPADRLPRGDWWTLAHDAQLDRLESELDTANPDLAAAVARHDEASAFLEQNDATLYPQVGLTGSMLNNRQSANRPLRGGTQPTFYGADTVAVGANWTIDLWGRVRNAVESARDLANASADDLENVRLSLHVQMADTYLSLRGADAQLQLLGDTERAFQRALNIADNQYKGGIAPSADVTRARAQLFSVKAQIADLKAQRALLEHALASLAGVPAGAFSLAPDLTPLSFDMVPTDVPSMLLQRRPDIAAAERRTAAANASIGVARAAYFPQISLGPTIGLQSTGTSGWLTAPNTFWALGPSLAMTLFDGGLRRAQVRAAQAKLDEESATYRSTVLRAFQQVEDNLALLHRLREEAEAEDVAVTNSQRTLDLLMGQYRAGAVDYLNVFTAQTQALQTAQTALQLRTRYLRASVDLVQALGGGWTAPSVQAAAAQPSAAASSAAPAALPSTPPPPVQPGESSPPAADDSSAPVAAAGGVPLGATVPGGGVAG